MYSVTDDRVYHLKHGAWVCIGNWANRTFHPLNNTAVTATLMRFLLEHQQYDYESPRFELASR